MRFGRVAAVLTCVCACFALLAPSALGAHDAELSMMDDQALLGASQAKINATLARMQALGATRLRVSAFWSDIAPAATSAKRPRGFKAANPASPGYDWSDLDRVVGSAVGHGMKVLISISTPIPYWASQQAALKNNVWEPKPIEFEQFAFAVAYRYRFAADQFALLNEPNQGAWLQPQSLRGQLVAPHLFRALTQVGYAAVKAADPRATVLVGELAPSGRNDRGVTRPIRPLLFLRTAACRDAHYRALRSGRCRGFKPIPLDALGHHPYSIFQSPFARSQYPDDAAIGDWRRLESTVDRLVRAGALKPGRRGKVRIYYTEFGYQTNPPDPFAGVSLSQQSRWLQEAAYVAWSTPRVEGLNQFRVTDGRIRGNGPLAYREFQSGLYFANGKAKPAARTFRAPIVLRSSGRSRLLVWGQVRRGGRHRVVVERRLAGSKRFRQVAVAETNAEGYFTTRVARRGGAYRFRWSEPSGSGASQALSVKG